MLSAKATDGRALFPGCDSDDWSPGLDSADTPIPAADQALVDHRFGRLPARSQVRQRRQRFARLVSIGAPADAPNPVRHVVRAAGAMESPALVDLLAEGFVDLEVARWLTPDAVQRRVLARASMAALLGNWRAVDDDEPEATTSHRVDVVDTRVGAAVWVDLPCDEARMDVWPALGGLAGEPGVRWKQLRHLVRRGLTQVRGRVVGPCQALLFAGVHRGHRGVGVCSALVSHRVERFDAGGLRALAVVTSAAGRRLLEQHFFHVIADIGPDHGVPLWVMLRHPSALRPSRLRATGDDERWDAA
jgi:hypothetical protein